MTISKREFLVQMTYFTLGAGIGFVSREVVWTGRQDRRFLLYNIMKELRKDMSRSEVEAIINHHYAPFVGRFEMQNTVTLSVWLSALRALYLKVIFSDQKLARAEFVGIDSPTDVPPDAPPSIA